MLTNRRRFLLFAAPAIVAAPSLMRLSMAAIEPVIDAPGLVAYADATWWRIVMEESCEWGQIAFHQDALVQRMMVA